LPIESEHLGMRFTNFLLPIIGISGLACSAGADTNIWFTVSYGGQIVGYSHTQTIGRQTESNQKLIFKRLGKSLTMVAHSSTTENALGQIVSFRGEMSSSNTSTVNEGRVTGQAIELNTIADGKSYRRSLKSPAELLGSDAIDHRSSKELTKTGDKLNAWTIEPVSATIIEVVRTCLGTDLVKVGVRIVSAVKIHETMSAAGIDHTIWLDSEGHLVRSVDNSPIGEAIFQRATEQAARAADGGAEMPAEMYGRSVAKTNIRLPDPRSLTRLVLRLTNLHPESGWPPLASETQRILKQDSKTAIVEIVSPAVPTVTRNRTPDKRFLLPNAIIQSDDPTVRKLAVKIIKGAKDPWKMAVKLRDWETANMRFDAGVAVAPSSEVARDRRGTCFAYSSLLAGMCRSVGIPARFVMGFGYVEGMFGGHAWVDVQVGDRWIPLDAALTQPGPADAARLRCVTSTMESGFADFQTGGKLYGNVNIDVVEYTWHGRTVHVSSRSTPYTIVATRYVNPWLGISVNLPKGYRYADLDRVYPESTIFSASNGRAKITLEQNPLGSLTQGWPNDSFEAHARIRRLLIYGRRSSLQMSGSKAIAEIRDGLTIWRFIEIGPNAGAVLYRIIRSFTTSSPK